MPSFSKSPFRFMQDASARFGELVEFRLFTERVLPKLVD